MKSEEKALLIAPCGMNCGVCLAYLREKNKCHGCRDTQLNKPKTRANCKIRNCEHLKETNALFCFECEVFPCEKLKHLDKRYRTKYNMSEIENLENIKALGIKKFLENEAVRWICPKCNGTICVHKGYCIICGK